MTSESLIVQTTRAKALLLLLIGSSVFCGIAHAAPDNFGRAITVDVGSGPGGGYDLFGRLIARHIGKFIPGAPSIIVQNMPGAGSITAANYIFNEAPRDGTALGVMTPSLALLSALSAKGVRFKAAEFKWIGRLASNVSVTFTGQKSPIHTIADARAQEALISLIDDTSPLTLVTRVMNHTSGTRFKLIEGYPDSNSALMAVERGEAEGSTVSWNTLERVDKEQVEKHRINVLVQYTSLRSREMPDVPTALEDATSPENRQIMVLFVNGADVGYSLLAPPGLSPARLSVLRRAFDSMHRDPDFLADAAKLKIDLDPLDGASVQTVVNKVATPSESLLRAARAASEH